jgi:hypothetical protein
MPRQLRVEYPGAIYHVMSRGDRGEDVFLDDVDRLLGEHGIRKDGPAGRAQFERRMEARRAQATDGAAWAAVRRGWCLGSAEFRQERLDRLSGQWGEPHAGALRPESAQAKADRIVTEELERLGWTEGDLARRHQSDPEKLELAARLRRETTLTVKAIAARWHLGTWKSARTRLQQRKGRENPNEQIRML